MSETHLGSGSTCPPLAPGILRIYSMRYCPYAQRARLVLAHHEIPHETVNIKLTDKPEWFFSKCPAGTTPSLEQDDRLIQESGICMDYLDDITQGKALYPKDPYLKARMRLDMENAVKCVNGPWAKIFSCKDTELEGLVQEVRGLLPEVEKMVKGDFFYGDSPMMIDYFLWPWFERFSVYKGLTGTDPMSADQVPRLSAWYSRMVALPAVKMASASPDANATFMKKLRAGQVDYNIK